MNAGMTYKEVRYQIHDHGIEVYVFIQADGDCPIGVQGWHYKAFIDGVDSISDRLTDRPYDNLWSMNNISIRDSVLWAQKSPE